MQSGGYNSYSSGQGVNSSGADYGGSRGMQVNGYNGQNGQAYNSSGGDYGGGCYGRSNCKGGKSAGCKGGKDFYGDNGCRGGDYDGGDQYGQSFDYYPRYSQGAGPEYAQSELASTTLADETAVHVYGEQGEQIPKAIDSWDEAQNFFPPLLVQQCRNAGFEKPMPIQANTWGIGLQGRDLIGVAKTGSGKTLAYLFLGFYRILTQRPPSPAMVILAPTRELAQQIEAEAQKFGMPVRIRTACCYGGASRGPQLGQLRRGCQVIVACPGRLNDFIQQGQVRLNQCAFLVLDEADRMLDLGFEPQIRSIIETMPTVRQTLLYTATWPKELRSLASDFLTKPIHVNVGKGDRLEANPDITQVVKIVQNDQHKMEELREIFQLCKQGDRVLIFCETKVATADLANQLSQVEQIYSVAIHGDLAQRDRDWSLSNFKSGRAPILVATDVAARGLDVKGVTAVINWDAPHNAEDYVHRIGRTARAGEKGMAFTFLMPTEMRKARDIVNVMENTGCEVDPELLQLAGRNIRTGRSWGTKRKGKGDKGGKGGKGGKGKGRGKGGGGFMGGMGKFGGFGGK